MKRQLPLALMFVFMAASLAPANASDGELVIVGAGEAGHSGNARECDYWSYKHRGNSQGNVFGSCRAPFLKVYAQLQGASAGGITGVEFAVQIGEDGDPDPGYLIFELPTVATTVLGRAWTPPDPSPRGMNIGWNDCQTGEGGRVFLEDVIMIGFQECTDEITPPQLDFTGVQHSSPSNVLFRCPLFTLCDGPIFTKVCLGTDIVFCQNPNPPNPNNSKCSTSGRFSINPPENGNCKNLKADGTPLNTLQSATWSNVKSLYH